MKLVSFADIMTWVHFKAKVLKQLVRDVESPEKDLGHSERKPSK
jgi:predicted Rdx family selenoprotein